VAVPFEGPVGRAVQVEKHHTIPGRLGVVDRGEEREADPRRSRQQASVASTNPPWLGEAAFKPCARRLGEDFVARTAKQAVEEVSEAEGTMAESRAEDQRLRTVRGASGR
jgi:hypothetical protein